MSPYATEPWNLCMELNAQIPRFCCVTAHRRGFTIPIQLWQHSLRFTVNSQNTHPTYPAQLTQGSTVDRYVTVGWGDFAFFQEINFFNCVLGS